MGAAAFAGAGSVIEADALADSTNITFAAWLFIPSASPHGTLFYEGDNPRSGPPPGHYFTLDFQPGDTLNFIVKAPSPNGLGYYSGVPTGRWFHFVGLADDQNHRMQLWIDGAKVAEQPFSGTANVGYHASRLQIGGSRFEGKLDDVRFYNRALSSQEITSLATAANPSLSLTLPEPSAVRAYNWRGSSLDSGSLRQTNGVSVFYTFVDDKNTNGLVDFADEFVTAEYLVKGTDASVVTSNRQSIAAPTAVQSYGLASVNFLNSSKVFFTGEPDGQVFAWTATGTTNPLQRQLFSAHHAGKAWHALSAVQTPESGEGLVGLRVDPEGPKRCDVVFWPPQSELPKTLDVPQTAPVAQVLPASGTAVVVARVPIRLWDAEGNASRPELQFQLQGSSNWTDAAVVLVDGLVYSAATRVEAPPTGASHVLWWNAASDLGAGPATNVYLRTRATDVSMTGSWSQPVLYPVEVSTDADTDGDGVNDLQEMANGTDPFVPNLPSLARPSFSASGGSFHAIVNGFPGGRYTVEASTNLVDWTTVGTVNSTSSQTPFQDASASDFNWRFYRVRGR